MGLHLNRIGILIFLLSVAGFPPDVYGETVFLRSGDVIIGKVLRQSRASVSIRTRRGVRTISKKRVRRISYNKADERRALTARGKAARARRARAERERARIEEARRRRVAAKAKGEPSPSRDIQLNVLWRSALLPGWGQYNDGRRTAAYAHGGLFLAGLVNLAAARRAHDSFSDGYDDLFNPSAGSGLLLAAGGILNPSADGRPIAFLASRFHTMRREIGVRNQNIQVARASLALVYLWNMLDAFFSSRGGDLRDTSSSPNFQPPIYSLIVAPATGGKAISVGISLHL